MMQIDESRPAKRHCKLYEVRDDEAEADTGSRDSHSSSVADTSALWQSRMIETSEDRGRVIYVGDTATLAYLQIVRMLFETFLGDQSDFTNDGLRHTILEKKISMPASVRHSTVLPDRPTTEALVESFFVHTVGFLELFDRGPFLESVGCCFTNPFTVQPAFLSQLYLVLAIGLILANHDITTHSGLLISKLQIQREFYTESFFKNARSLADFHPDFESANLSTIEILLLIAIWKLVSWRRDSAHHYLGIAVHSAYAIGLHQEPNDVLFSPPEQRQRRKVWRSLMIFDSFLGAAGLGRPLAISHEDYPSFSHGDSPVKACIECSSPTRPENLRCLAAQASRKTGRILAMVLRKLYARHRLSPAVAGELVGTFEDWNRSLPEILHWKRLQDGTLDAAHGVAILHVNIFQLNAIILLTRPFYLFHMKSALPESREARAKQFRAPKALQSLSQSCIEASYHLLFLTHAAWRRGILSQCSPFAIHPVFAATLIILTNDFAPLYRTPDSEVVFQNTRAVLEFCAKKDFQAQRYLDIVDRFHDSTRPKLSSREGPLMPPGTPATIQHVMHDKDYDPMYTLSSHGRPARRANSKNATAQAAGAHMQPGEAQRNCPAMQPSPEGNISIHSGGTVSTATLEASGVLMEAGPMCEVEFYYHDLYEKTRQHQVGEMTTECSPDSRVPLAQLSTWGGGRMDSA
ncbi:hypothetical protein Micbo1qcDRAFT_221064 [Microdochium bolleyi]|uniref:Xylanolytic transcriptional activator regulatory domain-containing protein n=1 Tax=Microdochium bolleyi TaxID=196109 RepID=A0A136JBL4_9PEZI|nr:hypothetical protein Micbo1qcDRAFT_221064 [Microdochium bolleyi]